MKATLADALAVTCRIAPSINLSPKDSRVVGYINSAQQLLLSKGHWWGTCPKYTVQVTDQLFTLPPQFATMEQVAVSREPIDIRTQWYEFNSAGWGVVNDPDATTPNTACRAALFRGRFCSFKSIAGSGLKLRVQCDLAADVGTQITLLGYDDATTPNWIRTNPTGTYQDGEIVLASQTPGTLSALNFSKLTGVRKPRTNGQIWLYTEDALGNRVLIGQYQHWETNPEYSRYLLPTIPTQATQVDFVGKLAFRPAVEPEDELIITNLEALKLAVMAVRLTEIGSTAEAALLMNGRRDGMGKVIADGAVTMLDEELNHYEGSGYRPVARVEGLGHPPVPALI